MFKAILTLLLCCIWHGYAGTRDIPESVRRGYAEKFHNAFILQCNGLSTRAFWMFKDAYQTALQAGEEVQKLDTLGTLFRWYRTHGSPMILFSKEPQGDDIIYPDGTRPSRKNFSPSYNYNSSSYDSEYGRTPEQAAKIREFMFGVANTISGIFCMVVGGGILTPVGAVGLGLTSSGIYMMFNSLNNAYADYERAKLELQVVEAQAKKACEKDGKSS